MFKFTILILALLALSASAFRMKSGSGISNYNFTQEQEEMFQEDYDACLASLCPTEEDQCDVVEVEACVAEAVMASKFIFMIEHQNYLFFNLLYQNLGKGLFT